MSLKTFITVINRSAQKLVIKDTFYTELFKGVKDEITDALLDKEIIDMDVENSTLYLIVS